MTTRITLNDVPQGIITSMMKVESYVQGTGLDPKMLDLVRFRVSQINQCAYCIDMHFKQAIAAGEDAQRLYSVSAWKETDFCTESERAALRWAESVTSPGVHIDEQVAFTELTRFYDQGQVANLTFAVVQINGWNRLARSFGFEPGSYAVTRVRSRE
jgi:AhpD family alkylhydroperoxidase